MSGNRKRALCPSSSSEDDELSLPELKPGDPLCTREKHQPYRPSAPFKYFKRGEYFRALPFQKKKRQNSHLPNPIQRRRSVPYQRDWSKTAYVAILRPLVIQPISISCVNYQINNITFPCGCKKNNTDGGHSSLDGQTGSQITPPLVEAMEVDDNEPTEPADQVADALSEYLRKCSLNKK